MPTVAYYHANREEIDSDIATEEAAIEEIFPTSAKWMGWSRVQP